MSHSDDAGLVLPPLVAPLHIVIIPIFKTEEELNQITEYLFPLLESFEKMTLQVNSVFLEKDVDVTYKIDDDDQKSPGWKFAQWEMQGVPVRIAVGKRDIENGVVEIARRDTGEKALVKIDEASTYIEHTLYDIQKSLLQRSQSRREDHTFIVDSWEDFEEKIQQ